MGLVCPSRLSDEPKLYLGLKQVWWRSNSLFQISNDVIQFVVQPRLDLGNRRFQVVGPRPWHIVQEIRVFFEALLFLERHLSLVQFLSLAEKPDSLLLFLLEPRRPVENDSLILFCDLLRTVLQVVNDLLVWVAGVFAEGEALEIRGPAGLVCPWPWNLIARGLLEENSKTEALLLLCSLLVSLFSFFPLLCA